jgi:tetratricopeptide (TPR) repeat protein
VPRKRHEVLMAATLLLCGLPYGAPSADPISDGPQATSPSPGGNSISGLNAKQDQDGNWLVEFDYVFTGKPKTAVFRIEVTPQSGTTTAAFNGSVGRLFPPESGAHHVLTSLRYPGEGTSDQIIVTMAGASPDGKVLASQRINKVITWPTQDEKDFDTAYDMIDNGSRELLRQARLTLERLIAKNPDFDPGYVELARIAMKANWGPEGLHQAETLLDSALKIRPDSVNAKILLGYVYTHQHRFREAEHLFVDAARSNPPNLWLWANWGELLAMRGDFDQAVAKYRQVVSQPMSSSRNFRARQDAYSHLLQLLEMRRDFDGMEELYKQRIKEFGPSSCFSADYARFKLDVRGDAQGAIDLARGALNLNCQDAPSRQILGLASYVKWAESDGKESIEALNEARIFLPAGPMVLYLLASRDSTMSAAKKLISTGEMIDQKDNNEMTALALALEMGKLDAVARLLSLGARPDALVSTEEIPVALLPVLERDVAAIGVMQRAGVDYSKVRYRGATALDFAKQIGDDALLKVLTPKENKL